MPDMNPGIPLFLSNRLAYVITARSSGKTERQGLHSLPVFAW